MNNFVTRTLSATVYAGLVVSSILVSHIYLGIVLLSFSLLSVREYMHLMHTSDAARGGLFRTLITMPAAGVLFAAYYCNGGLNTPCSTVTYVCLLLIALISELFLKSADPIRNWGDILATQVMIALPFALMTGIYGHSKYYLLALFILIWVNDSGAYIVGSLMSKRKGGNHKMFARVSPNKSWEGLIGGVVFALLGGWVMQIVGWLPSVPFAVVFALIISIFGTLGDLMESLMKRTLGVKDSGKLMPGHGGALDRFDSLLLATPAIWLLLLCWPA